MANEMVHATVGTALTQAEFEAVGLHVLNSQATGDLIYASSASQLSRLGIGATNTVLTVIGGVPTWQSALTVVWAYTANVLADLNRTTALAATDLDLTAATSANAKFVILQVTIGIDSITAGAANFAELYINQNGQSPKGWYRFRIDGAGSAASSLQHGQCIMGMDAGQVIEYELDVGGTIQFDTFISVLGYIE